MQQLNVSILPFQGAPSTAAAIQRAIAASRHHYSVRQLAEKITEGLRSKDYLSEAIAIYHFVFTNVRYMRDPAKVELVKEPWILTEQILEGGRPQGDCDDMTALIGALLSASGATIRIVAAAFKHVFYKGERQYSHVFVQVQEPRSGAWITLDPVAGKRIGQMHRRIIAAKIFSVL